MPSNRRRGRKVQSLPRDVLVAGTPEVREYRMRFWDNVTPNGDWTDVVKVTVSP